MSNNVIKLDEFLKSCHCGISDKQQIASLTDSIFKISLKDLCRDGDLETKNDYIFLIHEFLHLDENKMFDMEFKDAINFSVLASYHLDTGYYLDDDDYQYFEEIDYKLQIRSLACILYRAATKNKLVDRFFSINLYSFLNYVRIKNSVYSPASFSKDLVKILSDNFEKLGLRLNERTTIRSFLKALVFPLGKECDAKTGKFSEKGNLIMDCLNIFLTEPTIYLRKESPKWKDNLNKYTGSLEGNPETPTVDNFANNAH